ncbi:histidine phosphatase family protein [bacterium]|nr:histidine phosphatase family protein [bacterium]
MLELWWIRHGQSRWNVESRWQGHSDIELSPEGEQQALRLRERLAEVHFDSIYSSDLRRAVRTAELALPGREVIRDGRLREVNFGEFEGLTKGEMTPAQLDRLREWFRDPYAARVLNGESLGDVELRIQSWQAELPESGRVAIFTHGGVIRCHLWANSPGPGGVWKVQIDNCSTTCLLHGRETVEVLWVNQVE